MDWLAQRLWRFDIFPFWRHGTLGTQTANVTFLFLIYFTIFFYCFLVFPTDTAWLTTVNRTRAKQKHKRYEQMRGAFLRAFEPFLRDIPTTSGSDVYTVKVESQHLCFARPTSNSHAPIPPLRETR